LPQLGHRARCTARQTSVQSADWFTSRLERSVYSQILWWVALGYWLIKLGRWHPSTTDIYVLSLTDSHSLSSFYHHRSRPHPYRALEVTVLRDTVSASGLYMVLVSRPGKPKWAPSPTAKRLSRTTKQCVAYAHRVLSYKMLPATRQLSRSPPRRAPCSTFLKRASVPSR